MKKINFLKTWLMLVMLLVGVGTTWAEEYSFTIQTSDFNTTSYDANNGSHDFTATSKTDKTKTMTVACTSNQVMKNSNNMQWQKSKGYIYNTTDLGTIKSVTVNSSAGTFTTYYGTTEHPTSGTTVGNGFFTVKVGNATGTTSSIVVVFETSGGGPTPDTRTAVNMTGFSATETTLVKGGTTNTTVTNDQNGWTAAYTYESSNINIATVSNTGVITAVAKGTAKITASLNIANDDATWKKGATTSKSIDITVNNPSHTAQFSINGSINAGNNKTVEEGEAITFPSDPKIDDVVFMGWTKSEIDGTSDNVPSDLCKSATMGTDDVTYYAVFANDVTTTFDPNDLTSTPSNGTLSWKNSTTGVQLKLSAGSLYTSGSPKTFTVTAGTSNYFQVTSDNAPISKIETTISTTDYKINSVSAGATLKTSSTTQTITCSSTDVKAYATSSKQIRATQIVVTTASDFCTTVKAVTGVAVKTAPTTVDYCEGEKFNPAGLIVTLTYEGATTKDVAYSDATASKFTFSPALTAALASTDDNVQITINGQNCNQAISVRSVSISAPVVAEGSYTVKVGDAAAVTADGNTINALKGQKIVLASTPATGYKPASTPFIVTDEDDANVSVSTAGGQYSFTMPGKNVTIAAKFTRVYTITAGEFEHGDITAIKDKDGASITETSKGSKVVVEASADTHYHLTGMYYVKEGEETHNAINESEGVYSFTMPQSNVTVYATFAEDEKFEVNWVVNGATVKTENLYADVQVSAPEVSEQGGKMFRGWVDSEIDGTTDIKPSFVNVSNLTVSEAKIFYAVFATASVGEDFELVENLANIQDGEAYIGSYLNYSGSRYYVATSATDLVNATVTDKVLTIPANAIKLTFVSTGTANEFYIKNESGDYLNVTSSDWASFTSTACALTFSGNSPYALKTSTGNNYLRAYGSSTTAGKLKRYASQTNTGICVFQKAASYSDYCTTAQITPTLEFAAAEYWVSAGATIVSPEVETNTDGELSYSAEGGHATVDAANGSVSLTGTLGDVTVTVNAAATATYAAGSASYTLHVVAPETVTVSAARWATYAPNHTVELPAGVYEENAVRVYYVAGMEYVEASTSITEGKTIAAGTGILVKAEAGSYAFPVNTTVEPTELTGNQLVGVLESTSLGDKENAYIFKSGSQGIGFYPWANGNLAANKCYLQLDPSAGAPAFLRLPQDTDTATDIEMLQTEAGQNAVKFFQEGHIYIRVNERVYDANGRLVE